MEIKKDYWLEKRGNRQVWQTIYYEGKETDDLEELKKKVYRYKITAFDLSKKLNKRIFLSIRIPSYFFGRESKNFIEEIYKLLLSVSFWKHFELYANYACKNLKPNKITSEVKKLGGERLGEYHKTIDEIIGLIDKEIAHLTVSSRIHKIKGQYREILKIERRELPISHKEKLFKGKFEVAYNNTEIWIEI